MEVITDLLEIVCIWIIGVFGWMVYIPLESEQEISNKDT